MALDSFGIGAIEDVKHFNDVGADTLGHIAEACTKGEADSGRKGPLSLSNLTHLGLAKTHGGSTGSIPAGINGNAEVTGAYTWTREMPSDKDTPSGHWGIVDIPVLFEWGCFSNHENSFSQELLDKLAERINLPDYFGNCRPSGTIILDQLDEGHVKTGKPVLYIFADSVFQIACHGEIFSLDRLYELCEIAHEELANGGYNIDRTITHPFIGDEADNFQHTGNRYGLTIGPPTPTVLQKLANERHGQAISVGETAGIYTDRGITEKMKVTGLNMLFNVIIKEMKETGDNTIVFANFADSDSSWGHRRDVAGYAAGLKLFGRHLPELVFLLCGDDILILTADHGCGPTWTDTDHTHGYTPVLVYGPRVKSDSLGHRKTSVDIGQTLARYFGTSDMECSRAVF